MASIKVCVETLLAHRNIGEEKQEQFLQRCMANVERLQKLLTDISLITRLTDGAESIVREPVDLTAIISAVADDRRVVADAKGMLIENDVTRRLPITGNASLLEAVFNNLIDNAIAYSGGTVVRIRLLRADERRIELELSDNGVGVAPEHLPRLFERFYRIDKGRSRAAGGTGLGLSIVKNAITLHGGTIVAENIATGGLRFRITLRASGPESPSAL